jgi:hypothetical protein
VLDHYASQTDDQTIAEDEAARDDASGTTMTIPTELVPDVRDMIARHKRRAWPAARIASVHLMH